MIDLSKTGVNQFWSGCCNYYYVTKLTVEAVKCYNREKKKTQIIMFDWYIG